MITNICTSTKKYNIIYADPPWHYPKTGGSKNSRGMAKQYYTTMPTPEICALPIPNIADKNCALFLWVTGPMLPDGITVMNAWGFVYYGVAFDWVKTTKNGNYHFGMGHWTRANTELCLLGFQGKMVPQSHSVPELLISPCRKHSQKPDEVRNRIVQLCGNQPRIELFARQVFPGWDCWGNEIEEP